MADAFRPKSRRRTFAAVADGGYSSRNGYFDDDDDLQQQQPSHLEFPNTRRVEESIHDDWAAEQHEDAQQQPPAHTMTSRRVSRRPTPTSFQQTHNEHDEGGRDATHDDYSQNAPRASSSATHQHASATLPVASVTPRMATSLAAITSRTAAVVGKSPTTAAIPLSSGIAFSPPQTTSIREFTRQQFNAVEKNTGAWWYLFVVSLAQIVNSFVWTPMAVWQLLMKYLLLRICRQGRRLSEIHSSVIMFTLHSNVEMAILAIGLSFLGRIMMPSMMALVGVVAIIAGVLLNHMNTFSMTLPLGLSILMLNAAFLVCQWIYLPWVLYFIVFIILFISDVSLIACTWASINMPSIDIDDKDATWDDIRYAVECSMGVWQLDSHFANESASLMTPNNEDASADATASRKVTALDEVIVYTGVAVLATCRWRNELEVIGSGINLALIGIHTAWHSTKMSVIPVPPMWQRPHFKASDRRANEAFLLRHPPIKHTHTRIPLLQ